MNFHMWNHHHMFIRFHTQCHLYLKDHISAEKLLCINKMMRMLPKEISFKDFREIHQLHIVLPKVEDPKKFVFQCSISGFAFKEHLCDSRYNGNVRLEEIAEKLRVDRIQPLKMTLSFSNSSPTTPYGTIPKLYVAC
ncbi:hypothetical protein IGI04_014019 [Brassica rapa subsp. trilocularis]|uniref:Uncharacterized protein n=1 Tax=Brassica rapa subsp. trilocularis TaxID=1813537 RepID=A0ABQ7NAG1_BRACM|nr:hypothetical protein IGI04_014019 [Brassica rapa subsp. trilocularis]